MTKKARKTSSAKGQSIGTTLKSLTLNFGSLARDAQLIALMELTNLYKRTKATAATRTDAPAKKKVKNAARTVKKTARKAAKSAKTSANKNRARL